MLFDVSQISPDVELVFANSDKYINVYPSYHQVGGMNYRNVSQADWEAVGSQYRWAAPMPQITDETIPVIQLVYPYGSTDVEQQQQYAAFRSITNVETVSGSLYLYTPMRPAVNFRIRFKILNKMDLAILLNQLFGIGMAYSASREDVNALLTGLNPITGVTGVISSVLPLAANNGAGVVEAGVISRLIKLEDMYDRSMQKPFKIESRDINNVITTVYYDDQTDICSVPAGTWLDHCSIFTATNAIFTNATRLFYQQQAKFLDLTHVYSGNVTSFCYALACNEQLREIYGLDLLDTHSAEDISYMFSDNSALDEVDLSKLNLENVTNIEGLFKGCTTIHEINVSSIDFTKVGVGDVPLIEQPDVFTGVPNDCTIWVSGETQREAIIEQYPNLTGITYN